MTRPAPLAVALATALTLAGCHARPAGNPLDAIDNQLVNGTATAEGGDLRDAITVDRKRAGGKPAATADKPASGDCLTRYGPTLAYSDGWAKKLPADLPVHPQAKLAEAAGHDGGCAVRVASFTVPGERAAVLDWYTARARAAGYSAARETKGGDVLLAGSKGRASYTVIAGEPKNGAIPVDLVWTQAD